jgi:PKD repeat protein
MSVTADFTVSNRAADRFNTVTFTDVSVGTITGRTWVLGDGTVVDGNDTSVKHTYTAPGKYTVTLIVRDSVDQDSETKVDYIIVNDVVPTPSFVIMQTFEAFSGAYWRFYVDSQFHLVFETPQYIYRSSDAVIGIKQWSLVQFDPVTEKMYWGSYMGNYREIVRTKSYNTSPVIPLMTKTEIAAQSTMKIDELMVWSVSRDLYDYHRGTRGKAGYLDMRT